MRKMFWILLLWAFIAAGAIGVVTVLDPAPAPGQRLATHTGTEFIEGEAVFARNLCKSRRAIEKVGEAYAASDAEGEAVHQLYVDTGECIVFTSVVPLTLVARLRTYLWDRAVRAEAWRVNFNGVQRFTLLLLSGSSAPSSTSGQFI